MNPSKESSYPYGVWMEGNHIIILTRMIDDPKIKKLIAEYNIERKWRSCGGVVTCFKIKEE